MNGQFRSVLLYIYIYIYINDHKHTALVLQYDQLFCKKLACNIALALQKSHFNKVGSNQLLKCGSTSTEE